MIPGKAADADVTMVFKDVATGLEAGRRMMTSRLDPLVIRMYDPHSTGLLVKRVLVTVPAPAKGDLYWRVTDGRALARGLDGDP